MTYAPLGELTADQFLRTHWQKQPYIARHALADIESLLEIDAILQLACREDVESRLITRFDRRWSVQQGPFRARELKRLPDRDWTLLVHGIDTHLPGARRLMSQFGFIPYARQDDLMVSIAPPGGGVGPHFDSYDVFLVQARGRRRWRFGAQSDLRLVDNAPLKILRHFRPTRELIVDPGDVLYLPPRYAHDGIAETQCMTCSIGFRAPSASELTTAFLRWLEDEMEVTGQYTDPDLRVQPHPAQIGDTMVAQLTRMLAPLEDWRSYAGRFLGAYLSEPKPGVWFSPPLRPIDLRSFGRRARRTGIQLSLKTRMLFRGPSIFINGEAVVAPSTAQAILAKLADQRVLTPLPRCSAAVTKQLHAWYRRGYIEIV